MRGRAKSQFQGTVLIADDHEVFRIGLVHLRRRSLKGRKISRGGTLRAQVVEHLKDEDVTPMRRRWASS